MIERLFSTTHTQTHVDENWFLYLNVYSFSVNISPWWRRRYWAVTNIDYVHQRTARRIGIMILIVWALSFLVSAAPLLGWKDDGWEERVAVNLTCIVSQDIAYQIFATSSSFYVPLLVILILYWRIFQTARKRIRRRHHNRNQVGQEVSFIMHSLVLSFTFLV